MKKQLTDAEKFFAVFFILLGTVLGIFVAPIFDISAITAGSIGLIIGSLFAFRIVRETLYSGHKAGIHRKVKTHTIDDLFMSLVIKRLKESYRADHPESPYAQNSNDDESEEDLNKEDDISADEVKDIRNKLVVEMKMQAEKEKTHESSAKQIVINFGEETAEDDISDENTERNADTEEEDGDEVEESNLSQAGAPSYAFSIQQNNAEEDHHWLTAIILSPHTSLAFAAFWIIATLVSLNYFPKLLNFILRFVSSANFVILPAFFLIGLSGIMEIFQSRSKDDFVDLDAKISLPISGILKLTAGWGFCLFVLFKSI